ncbi:MAG: hypothetical protein WAT93_13120 [Pontixanthobacter sp.]
MQQESNSTVQIQQIMVQAIGRRRLVVANYNGVTMQLAPHQLFTRHDEPYLTALNIGKSWNSEEDKRLGQFKIAGLSDVALTEDAFEPLPAFDNSLPREEDRPVFAVA